MLKGKKNNFVLFIKNKAKVYKVGICKIDESKNFFFFVKIRKFLNIFFKNKGLFLIKLRLNLKFSLLKIKMFIGFLKILLKFLKK